MTNAELFSGVLQQLFDDSVVSHTNDEKGGQNLSQTDATHLLEPLYDPSTNPLQRICVRRANGEAYASIAAALNKEGCCGGYGGRWYASSVWAYLHRHSQVASDPGKPALEQKSRV